MLTVRDHVGGERFHLTRCGQCGLAFIVDPPLPADLPNYYLNPHGAAMTGDPGHFFRSLQGIALGRDLRLLLRRIRRSDLLLDLGAGDGSLSRYLASKGQRVEARDMGIGQHWSVAHVPYRQVDLNSLVIDDLGDRQTPATAVVMRHVLEHLYRPVDVLTTIHEAGVRYVLLVVPNLGSPFRRIFGESWFFWEPPRHLLHFTDSSIKRLSEESNYRVVALDHYGIDEIVTSTHRALQLRARTNSTSWLATLLGPVFRAKGPLTAVSSVLAAPIVPSVIRVLLERR
jgi:hypothetical protein